MAPAATNPATVQLPSALTLQGPPLPVSSRGGAGAGVGVGQQPRQPSWPFPGDDVTPGCAPSGSGLCSEGGPMSPTPGEAAAQGHYLNFPTTAHPVPGAQSCTVLSSGRLVEEGPTISLTPGPRRSDLSSCALAREEPRCHWLAASIPTVCGPRGARPGGWHWQQVPLPPPAVPPFSHTKRPGSGTTERQLWAVLHWPRLAPRSPATPTPPSPGWARPHLPRTRGGPAWTGRAAQREGPGGASPRLSRPVSVPPGLSSPTAPCPVSATAPPARRMSPCASRAALCGVAPSPRPPPTPGAGLAHPPVPSTHSPGCSFADF